MVKCRPPCTVENALFKVLGAIGTERAGEVTGRSHHYILAMSDPDKRESLSVEDAIKLDLEYMAQGHEGAPIFEVYGRQLDAAGADRFSAAAEIAKLTLSLIKESGEAQCALVASTFPAAGPRELRDALEQLEDLDTIVDRAIGMLRQRVQPP